MDIMLDEQLTTLEPFRIIADQLILLDPDTFCTASLRVIPTDRNSGVDVLPYIILADDDIFCVSSGMFTRHLNPDVTRFDEVLLNC